MGPLTPPKQQLAPKRPSTQPALMAPSFMKMIGLRVSKSQSLAIDETSELQQNVTFPGRMLHCTVFWTRGWREKKVNHRCCKFLFCFWPGLAFHLFKSGMFDLPRARGKDVPLYCRSWHQIDLTVPPKGSQGLRGQLHPTLRETEQLPGRLFQQSDAHDENSLICS